ncbi:MAG TPA: hypothetical protein VGV88_01195 [Candidatus Dormibacteraeota bacterium]|nr:hypothetical protein [Candidatus Dormibacteraeota bacterium]
MAGKFKAIGCSMAACATLLNVGGGPASAAEAGATGDPAPIATLTLTSEHPAFGAAISFTATFPAMKWIPEESVECDQGGQMAYLDVQVEPNGTSPWASSFTLWSQSWADGGGAPADCTANLYFYTWKGHTETSVVYLGTTSFTTT